MPGTRVLLADDHELFLQALQKLLTPRYDVVGAVENGRALQESFRSLQPDVIVTDITMPLMNGLEAIRQLRKEGNLPKVVFLTMHDDAALVRECFDAGASAFLTKSSVSEELITAIEAVLMNHRYVSSLLPADVLTVRLHSRETDGHVDLLTSRQREILQLFAEGNTMKEIARMMNLSTRTVEWHKYRMMRSLHAENSAQLVRHALKAKLVF
jgi:DNA-binding NarL/FixJ family response regulator